MKNLYPWYDANWLTDFSQVKKLIIERYPEKLSKFLSTIEPLRTRKDYTIGSFQNLLDQKTLEEARNLIKHLKNEEREKYEIFSFGRLIIHDHPFFNELQQSFTDIVSEAAAEPVEPYYNFLSLYTELGVCPIHMDAPDAKWTLDCCIDQSEPWPIHFSQVRPWPEDVKFCEKNWEKEILDDPQNKFSSYTLNAGDAILFSGSSQWHYRERIPTANKNNFCHLIFFHFIPKGTREITDPKNWAEYFDISEINSLELSSNRNNIAEQNPRK